MVLFDFIAQNLGVSMMALSLILVAFHGRELMKWAGLLFVALLGVANAAGVVDLSVHLDRLVELAGDLGGLVGPAIADALERVV